MKSRFNRLVFAFVLFGLTPHAAQYPKRSLSFALNRRPFHRTYSAKITRFFTATSRFIAHQAYIVYTISNILSIGFKKFFETFSHFFKKMISIVRYANSTLSFPLFLYKINKNNFFIKNCYLFSKYMI